MRLISAGSQVRILPRPPSEGIRANNDRFEFEQWKKFRNPNRPQAAWLGWFFDIYIQVSNAIFRVESEIRPEKPGHENFSYHNFPRP